MKLTLSIEDSRICFRNEEHGFYGYTTYEELFWNWIKQVPWTVDTQLYLKGKKTYIKTNSDKFAGHSALHQAVMVHWYGLEEFNEAKAKGFIVEHHNNEAFRCNIENLSFAHKDLNLAKAHTYDKTRHRLIGQAAVNFYKDFSTRQYQIAMVFNERYFIVIDDKPIEVHRLYFLYDDDFRIVFTDANRIVDELLINRRIDFRLLSFKDGRYVEPNLYIPKKGEKLTGINIIEDEETGDVFMVVANDSKDHIRFHEIGPKKDLYEKE